MHCRVTGVGLIPFFYIPQIDTGEKEIELDEETSRHIISVLRMKKGEKLNLTDGKGNLMRCEITHDHKKHCRVNPVSRITYPSSTRRVTIAISLIKNTARFEWFLEKATEIGVSRIIPLICERTEKQKFRHDRMQNILISAMLQSQQVWLPVLSEVIPFAEVIHQSSDDQKFIAHCAPDEKRSLVDLVNENLSSQIILIGPEGDFTSPEIELAKKNHFTGVMLGETRLRTETAGIVAASLLKIN